MDRKRKTEEKVFSYIEEHHMLEAHDRVVAGISGGADSVCLLFVLLQYQERIPFSLAVVHVNHGIRAEAGEDAAFVEKLCRAQNIPFYLVKEKVDELAKEKKCSEEEAGRMVRYQAFNRVLEEFGGNKIAVAHNSNDRSETMLFHLFRGSGMKGLGSIRPVREQIIRPLLCLERREIEEYLEEREISYCKDITNETDDYTRNRIRHHILPYAEKEIASGCVTRMSQTADMLLDAEDYLEQQTKAAMAECVQENGLPQVNGKEITIGIEAFLKNHRVIRQRILFASVMELTPSGKDITYTHIRELLTLFEQTGNRNVDLPFGIVGRRRYDKVILGCVREQEEGQQICIEIPLPDAEEYTKDESCPSREKFLCRVPLGEKGELEMRLLWSERICGDFPPNQYTKWFDYDKMKPLLIARYRQQGDYLTIGGREGEVLHKSVKDYMITEKIPREERDRIPLLAIGNHVVWLIGYRISEEYKVCKNTKHVLQVQLIRKNCEDSKTEEKNGRAY